jgi:hypothetical protein
MTWSAATVIGVAPVGVEKTHPSTETTLFTASVERLLKLVRVVAPLVEVCTVMITGAQGGGLPGVLDGGTKKTGNVARVKLPELVAADATVPVI